MRFVRLTFGLKSGKLIGVAEQDTPYESAGAGAIRVSDEPTETVDLGCVELEACQRPDGAPCSIAEWIHVHHLGEYASREQVAAKVAAFGTGVKPRAGVLGYHAVPCTMEGLRAHLRAKGPEAMHVKVRAWLAVTLPQHHADAMGLGGVHIAALKAMERVRNMRDPYSGSRMQHFERVAQRLSDERSARALARRRQEK